MGGISKWYTKTCMVVGLCLIFMFEPVTSENTKPAFIRFLRRYQSGNSRVSGSEAQCANYMESCVPGKDQCCGDHQCLNYLKGYCLYPLENCWCMKGRIYNTDTYYK